MLCCEEGQEDGSCRLLTLRFSVCFLDSNELAFAAWKNGTSLTFSKWSGFACMSIVWVSLGPMDELLRMLRVESLCLCVPV